MRYEVHIGWRYLYRGPRSRRAALGFLISTLVALAGALLFFHSGGASGLGVVAVSGGMIASVLFALLYVFSVFTTVSVLGVVLGVAALTVVLAVTTGFQDEFRRKVLGVNAHIIVRKTTPDFTEYRDIEKLARSISPEVLAVQPFNIDEMLVTRGKGELSGVIVKGIDPRRVDSVLDLHQHMVAGKVEALERRGGPGEPPPIILGKVLAEKLKASVGDQVTLVSPLSNVDVESWTASGEAPRSRSFVVAGIFYSGFDEYDRRLMYIHLDESQKMLGRGDQVLGVEMKVSDVDRAQVLARALESALEQRYAVSPYLVQDWRELNRTLFTALTLQKIVVLIVLTLIIAVATFNMVSALTMMVIDKTREIAILKSMGATDGGIALIFEVIGVAIGGVGTLFGLVIGLVLCALMQRYNYPLDPQVYRIDRLPIALQPFEVGLVASITMLISAVATLLPSKRAAELAPVEGLRYD